jgi:hypothetical protein
MHEKKFKRNSSSLSSKIIFDEKKPQVLINFFDSYTVYHLICIFDKIL